VRKLGIPCVLDRFVQQAVLQVLQKRWDPTFSEHSHGFRPGRSAKQAVHEAQQYIAEGNRWVVDLDLEKFFDRVNHDRLLAAVAERVADKRMLKLIRAFLEAGVMEDGLVSAVDEGTPQGGPLSPLLSNLVLDELDRELERRGHRFARYADDCNLYVGSERAGQRVMESVTHFITHRLKLKVNQAKSAVARPRQRKFLGFSFTGEREPRRRIAPKAIARFKERIREQTRRTRGISLKQMVTQITTYLRDGSDTSTIVKRPRCCKLLNRGYAAAFGRWCEAMETGTDAVSRASQTGCGEGPGGANRRESSRPWRIANSPPWPSLCRMLTLSSSDSRLWSCGRLNPPNRRMRTRMSGGVAGEAGRPVPLCRFQLEASGQKHLNLLQLARRLPASERSPHSHSLTQRTHGNKSILGNDGFSFNTTSRYIAAMRAL